MRTTIFGFLAGIILSALRLPPGLDLTQVPAVDAVTAAIFRAAALAAIALVLSPRRTAFREGAIAGPLLVGATLGYAVHGLVLQPLWEPYCRTGFALLLLGSTVLLALAAGKRGPVETVDEKEAPNGIGRFGLFVGSLGATLAVVHLARYVRLLTVGTREGETVLGAVFLTALAIGAVAFGAPLVHSGRGRLARCAGLALAAATTLLGLRFVGGLNVDTFYGYLKRFDFDVTMVGMGRVTAVLGGASFVLPAFCLGTALAGSRRAGLMSTMLLGAAFGVLLDPFIVRAVAQPYLAADIADSTWAWTPFALASVVAGIGALLAGAPARGLERLLGNIAAVVCLALPWALPQVSVWPFSPWYATPIEPLVAIPSAEGLLTVEADGLGTVVTLDRCRLTPTAEEEAIDAQRIRASLALIDPEVRSSGNARVLLVGQLTPSRAHLFAEEGVQRVDRTAVWHRWMDALEDALFAAAQVPAGSVFSPAAAQRRIQDGSYDLIIVPSVRGTIEAHKSRVILDWAATDAPLVPRPELPKGTVAVTWVDLDTPMSHRPWSERVLLVTDRFIYTSLGFFAGDARIEPGSGQAAVLTTGEPTPRPPTWWQLETRSRLRGDRVRLGMIERLAQAQDDEANADLVRGLELHYRAQDHSSPFETLAQQIEFDEESARALLESIRKRGGAPLDSTTRAICESMAWVLSGKRFIEEILVYIEPVADAYAPWPFLDRAVLHAYQEFDEPEEAARILTRLVEAESGDISLMVEAARWHAAAGKHAESVRFARMAEAVQPERYDLRRLVGEMLLGAGDPEGERLLETLFEENPEDLEILDILTDGPSNPDPFAPPSRHDHDH